jgi:hypothetical protein
MTPTMSREQMIEAAAEAIHQTFAKRAGYLQPWNEVPQRLQENYCREAEAALRAAGAIDNHKREDEK